MDDDIAYYQDSLTWLNNAQRWGGRFIKAFAEACIYADSDNFALLRRALMALRSKYPTYEVTRG